MKLALEMEITPVLLHTPCWLLHLRSKFLTLSKLQVHSPNLPRGTVSTVSVYKVGTSFDLSPRLRCGDVLPGPRHGRNSEDSNSHCRLQSVTHRRLKDWWLVELVAIMRLLLAKLGSADNDYSKAFSPKDPSLLDMAQNAASSCFNWCIAKCCHLCLNSNGLHSPKK